MRGAARSLAVLLVAGLMALAPAAWAGDPVQLFSYEVIPAAQVELPRAEKAPYAQRGEFTAYVLAELVPEVLAAMGIDPAKVTSQVTAGGYLLKTSPSIQSEVAVPDRQADRVAAALGYVFRQSSVLVSDLRDGGGDTDYVVVRFPRGRLDAELAHRFFVHAAKVHQGLGGGYTAFGDDMIFLNLRDSDGAPYSGLDPASFQKAMRKAVSGFAGEKVTVGTVGVADARMITNNWDGFPEGEEYLTVLGAASGGTDQPVLVRLNALRDRHSALALEAADRYGWH